MNKCTTCGSHAINPHMHGRGGDRIDLCDVCYWREKAARREEALREIKQRAEFMNWGSVVTIASRVLEEKQ